MLTWRACKASSVEIDGAGLPGFSTASSGFTLLHCEKRSGEASDALIDGVARGGWPTYTRLPERAAPNSLASLAVDRTP